MIEGFAKKRGRGSFLRISEEEIPTKDGRGADAPDKAGAKAKKRRPAPSREGEASSDEDAALLEIAEGLSARKPAGPSARRAARASARAERATGGRGAAGRTGPRQGKPFALFLALGTGLVLLAAALILVPGTMVLRRVVVSGATSLAPADVVAASGVVPGTRLFANDTALARRNLEAWAPIAAAEASYQPPDAIRLAIVERKAVAFALVEDGPTTVPIAIDAEGYAFAKARTVDAPELPLLSGIRFDGWKPGMRLPSYLLPTVASIAVLEESDPALLSLFSEFRVERTNWGEVELVLFPLHHAIPVRTGPRLDAPLLRSIVLVLDALDKGGVAPKVGELDFRSGTIVFRSKEGSPG